jgi:hypothetical protein
LLSEIALVKGDQDKVKLLIERKGEKKMIDVITNYRTDKDFQEALKTLKNGSE